MRIQIGPLAEYIVGLSQSHGPDQSQSYAMSPSLHLFSFSGTCSNSEGKSGHYTSRKSQPHRSAPIRCVQGTYRVAREEGPAIHHLCKDAAYGPDVYGSGVVLAPQQYLRSTVPQRDDLDT